MTKSFHLFFVFLCISIIIVSAKLIPDSQSSTQIARRRHSELDGFVLQKSVIYIWAGFTLFLCLSVIFLTVLWIKDTVQLNNKVTELEKKIQDMEQYGVIKPPVPPLFVSAPETKPEEKKTIVKVVNEVKPSGTNKAEPTASKKKSEKREKIKQKTKKSIKKSTKNPQKQVENKNAKSVETDESKSSVSKEVTQSVTVDKTTEDSKTTENTISKTIAEKEPEEPSFPSSIATAEVLELSRRRY